ncbi:MAG: alanine racemase, partial [Muribaculaceae bacterium]|nr:alanine racemase [Muribaculaceae bacterium]
MSSIAERLDSIKATLPSGVELAAVSKFHPVEALMEAYRAGQRVFYESRAAELAMKAEALPPDIEWHFIGHLQTNKVKTVVPWVSVIQSIDSERLLRAVDAEASKIGRRVKVLLQVHVAAEE